MADQISPLKPRPRSHPSLWSCCCCSCFVAASFFLVSSLVVAFLVVSLSHKPKLPTFTIDRLNVTKLSVSTANHYSFLSYLDSSIDVSLKISNAKNITFVLDDVQLQILYDDSLVSLGRGALPGRFEVREENVRVVDARVGVKMKLVDQKRGGFVVDSFKANSLVLDMGWDLKMEGVWNGQLRRFPLKLLCHDVVLARVGQGYSPQCNTHISPWILWEQ